jgi:hypothetical protein
VETYTANKKWGAMWKIFLAKAGFIRCVELLFQSCVGEKEPRYKIFCARQHSSFEGMMKNFQSCQCEFYKKILLEAV